MDRLDTFFAPISRILVPAEGSLDRHGVPDINEDLPGFDPVSNPQGPANVATPDSADETVVTVIGHADRVIFGLEGDQHAHRAEHLLASDPHVVADIFVALGVLGILWGLICPTHFGLEMRALADSPDAARIARVNTPCVAFLTFPLAGAIGAVAGVLIAGSDGQISPKFGRWDSKASTGTLAWSMQFLCARCLTC